MARGLFNSRVEDSPSLRLIVLVMGCWVALSLGWLGTPAWIWVGAAVLLAGGHAFSWYSRGSSSRARPIIVGVAVIGVLAMVPRTISLASNGDWLPIAHFLLLFQAATSFELRTRSGLYVSICISGVILFLVTQRALDATFGIFLAGFIALLLSFLASSFLMDQARQAEVRWFRSRLSFAWFWSGVVITCLVVSAAIFLLLPKHINDPITHAQGVVLPLRAGETVDLPGVAFDLEPATSALPLSPFDEGEEGVRTIGSGESDRTVVGASRRPDLTGISADSGQEGTHSSETGLKSPDSSSSVRSQLAQSPSAGPLGSSGRGEGTSFQFGGRSDAHQEDSLVMHVRSPVLTYWRGQAFDTFDGRSWHTGPEPWLLAPAGSPWASLRASEPLSLRGRPLYSQTYFIRQDLPPNTVFTGYAPRDASFPKTGEGATRLIEGSVYRAISRLPDFSAEALEKAVRSSGLGDRCYRIPHSSSGLRSLSQRITEGTSTDLERMRRLVTYLDWKYQYDEDAADQLLLTSPTADFLAGGSAGTSMDFASATVLLARAAGVPARLVTGYLPGQFDPLSGTYLVSESDQHAWAEIHLGRIGWVPFDSAPRPATAAFKEQSAFRFSSVSSLFSANYGDDIYQSLRSSPQRITGLISDLLGTNVLSRVAAGVGAAVLMVGGILAWRMAPSLRRRGQPVRYARLVGDGREEVLRIFLAAEKLLRRAGLAARAPGQTVGEYTAQVESGIGGARSDLAWIREATWAAAYDPVPHDQELLAEARGHLHGLKAALRDRRPQTP